jgi:hypothetical protein
MLMRSRFCRALGVAFAAAVLLLGRPALASIVLLDEYWTPEVMVNEVAVREVDTQQSHDRTQAKTGEFSAELRNETGAPNVRFRAAARVKLDELPSGKSQVSLWYRTNAWAGPWRLEIWVYRDEITPIPVKVMEALLDGGGVVGSLVTDDKWHQARGTLQAAGDYAKLPHNERLVTYVWLAPAGVWDVKHRTFVDRIEVKVPGSGPAPAPARHVRPRPGAQVTGDGWIWWEGEDATSSDVPAGGAFLPDTAAQQKLLSNGAWLQHHGSGFTATWQVDVKQAGRYHLWYRGVEEPFRWQMGVGDWHECGTGTKWLDNVQCWPIGTNMVSASWADLGEVDLPAGQQTLTVKSLPDTVLGVDCWLLTQRPFVPNGAAKPDGK